MARKLSIALLALIPCLLDDSRAAHAQCTSYLNYTGGSADLIRVDGFLISDAAIEAGIDKWEQCGTYGSGFPFMTTADVSADVTVTVNYIGGQGNTCGTATQLTPTTARIDLWDRGRTTDGQSYICHQSNTIAHELGHVLDLANSTCSGYLMGPAPLTWENGQMVASPREVATEECNYAHFRWETTPEAQNNNYPWCDAYCWTSCISGSCPQGHPGCPILIDLENDGIRLTGLNDPVWFDIDGDGVVELIAWTDRSEGILALDRNGNGTIDHGGELFGNATLLSDGTQALNGYLALADLDTLAWGGNDDGEIDRADAAFSDLRMWTDLNHDGISQPQELRTLDAVGLRRLDLRYRRSHRVDRYGNEFRFLGRAWKEGPYGVVRPILTWDVFFMTMP